MTWTTREGIEIPIENMTINHVKNSLKLKIKEYLIL